MTKNEVLYDLVKMYIGQRGNSAIDAIERAKDLYDRLDDAGMLPVSKSSLADDNTSNLSNSYSWVGKKFDKFSTIDLVVKNAGFKLINHNDTVYSDEAGRTINIKLNGCSWVAEMY